mmetsp:Transcript_16634/g.50128  ORF Transcript_16634/g.50128 Transcript_16634/m.50128 type:complete len:87 (-) Transcript_16634:3290-3550(-)
MSNVDRILLAANHTSALSLRELWYESCRITSFSLRKSTQTLYPLPCGFGTMTTGNPQGDSVGLMIPSRNHSLIVACKISSFGAFNL